MHYFPGFNLNNSLIGAIPSWFSQHFKYISKRALKILKNRSKKEIQFAALTINWIRENKSRNIFLKAAKKKNEDDLIFDADFENYEKLRIPTPTQLLIMELNKFDIKDDKSFPNATYSEYLSILALMLIGQAIENELIINGKKNKSKEIELLKFNGALATNAMEAICLSEELKKTPHPQELIESSAKEKLSRKCQTAANIKHKPKTKIKIKFIKFFNSQEFPSIAEAVRKFIKTLPQKEKSLLHKSPEVRNRFFRQALKGFRAGKIPII